MTFELLHGLLLLEVPEGTPGVGAGGEQLLIGAKEETVGDKLGVLRDALSRHGDFSDGAFPAHSIVNLVDRALVVKTTAHI